MAEISQSMPQIQHLDLLESYVRGVSAPGQLQALRSMARALRMSSWQSGS
jgi:hypothetical protein